MEWHELVNRIGYTSNLVGKKILVEIWNLIGNNYEILEDSKILLVQDDIDELINKSGIKTNQLSKPWRGYKTHYTILTYSEWEKENTIKQQRQLAIQKTEQLRQEAEQQDFIKLSQLRDSLSGVWWDEEKVQKEIGVTSTTPFAYYYWTIINGRIKKLDWKNNMGVDPTLYYQIFNDTTFTTYSGKNFLTRCHKNNKGYSCYIEDKITQSQPTIDLLGGIYGIYKNDVLYYIGLTTRPFQLRWQEHLDIICKKSPAPVGMVLYDGISSEDKIDFKPLIYVKDILTTSITLHDLEAMELGLITMYKPEGNYQGRLGVYKFSPGSEVQSIGA